MVIAGIAALLDATVASAAAPTFKNSTIVVGINLDNMGSLDVQNDQSDELVWIGLLTYESLVEYDDRRPGELKAKLAESWTLSPDRTEMTFKLRRGAAFASGHPVTAKDVVYSLERAVLTKGTMSGRLSRYGLTEQNVRTQVRAADPFTVRIRLPRPYATRIFLQFVESIDILDSRALRSKPADPWAGAAMRRGTYGSGPFQVTRYEPSSIVVLDRRRPRAGAVRRIVLRHVPEPGVQRLLLEQGEIDVAANLTQQDIQGALLRSKRVRTMVGPPGLLYHVAMNALRPPFDRPAARAALKLMFDYSAIRFLVGGTGDVLQVPFVQGGTTAPGRPMPFRFDLAKAKRLWAQAGYPKGLRLHLLATEEGLLRDILELFQQDARRIGVDVRLTFAGESLVYSRWRARDYMLAAGTTGPYGHFDAVDANNPATNFMWNPDNKATEFRRYRSWRSGYSNPLARRLVEQASQSGDEEERRRIYQQLTRIYIAEAPFVLLYSDRQTILVGKDLFGLRYTRGWDLSMAGKR